MSDYQIVDEEVIDEGLRIKILKRSSSPNWTLQWNQPGVGQRRRSLKTRNKKHARSLAQAFLRRFLTGEIEDPRTRTTLDEAAKLYLARLRDRDRSAKTVGNYERALNKLKAHLPRGGATPLDTLTIQVLEDFERTLREKGITVPPRPGERRSKRRATPLNRKTLRDAMKVVRGLVRFALKRGMIRRDPAPGYELPVAADATIKTFTSEELAYLFADPDPGMADIWRFFAATCLRAHEFIWLTHEDVVLDAQQKPAAVLIRKKVCPFTGQPWQPKHGRERAVPLTDPTVIGIVERSLASSPGPWLFPFPASRSHGRWTYGPLRARLYARLDAGGIEPRCLHILRHTGATRLASDSRMGLASLQKYLGHEHLATTQMYLHLNGEDVAASLKKVDFSAWLHPESSQANTRGPADGDGREPANPEPETAMVKHVK